MSLCNLIILTTVVFAALAKRSCVGFPTVDVVEAVLQSVESNPGPGQADRGL